LTEVPDVSTPVTPGSSLRFSLETAQVLANLSRRVHIRTSGQAETRSMTSVLPRAIGNLRNGIMLHPDTDITHWTGPMADEEHLTRAPCEDFFGSYPDIFETCTNPLGVHLVRDLSGWSDSVEENMEVYVR
jgi:hypothetical protein